MNYLAHAYFSFREPPLLVGNLISDFVKGKRQFDYPPEIQAGIRLHRAIDAFTDEHPATRAAKEIFRPAYRLYAGAFVDVVYDHFLANDTKHFEHEASLFDFSQFAYAVLHQHFDLLPANFQYMYQRMKEQNWLYNYRLRWGIEKSFGGLVYRSKYLHESQAAFDLFERHFDVLQDCYAAFAPDLQKMLSEWKAPLQQVE
jgi:acyl carrier protein phosphodiesterase